MTWTNHIGVFCKMNRTFERKKSRLASLTNGLKRYSFRKGSAIERTKKGVEQKDGQNRQKKVGNCQCKLHDRMY